MGKEPKKSTEILVKEPRKSTEILVEEPKKSTEILGKEPRNSIEILVKDEFCDDEVVMLHMDGQPSTKPVNTINQPSINSSKTVKRSLNEPLSSILQLRTNLNVKPEPILPTNAKVPHTNKSQFAKRQPLTENCSPKPDSSNLLKNESTQPQTFIITKSGIEAKTPKQDQKNTGVQQLIENFAKKIETDWCCILCEKILSSFSKKPLKCDGGCQNWFHLECLKIEYTKTIITWKCSDCTKGNLSTLLKGSFISVRGKGPNKSKLV